MVMHLEAQTNLREEDLEDDVMDLEVQELLNLEIDRKEGIIFLDKHKDNNARFGFQRYSAFDLKKGVLYVGNIQFERPALEILRGFRLPPSNEVVRLEKADTYPPVRIQEDRKPLLFAIERLFKKPLGQLEVSGFFCDGKAAHELLQREKTRVDAEMAKYRAMLAASETGKPLIEADYAARRRNEEYLGYDTRNMLYGERIHELLQEKL